MDYLHTAYWIAYCFIFKKLLGQNCTIDLRFHDVTYAALVEINDPYGSGTVLRK